MSFGGGGGDNKVKDTPEQRYLAQVAAEKWNYAQEQLAPIEQQYMESVGELTSPERMSYLRGQASQGQMQATGEITSQASQSLQSGGIDPSSGRYQTALSEGALGAAQAGGETAGRAQFEQENQQLQGLQNIVAMGQGQATQAQQGLSTIASQSAAEARQGATENFNRRNANLQLLGQVAGAGTAYGMGGGGAAAGAASGGGLNLYNQAQTSTPNWYNQTQTGGLQF